MNERLKEIQQEVDLMNKSFNFDSGTEAPSTEAPATEVPPEPGPTEAPSTESASTEAPSTESASTEAPSTEMPITEAPTDDKDKIIEELRAKLAEKESKETTSTKAPTTEAPLQLDEQDFVGDLDLDYISDPKELNKIFNRIYQKAVEDTRKVLGEGVLRSIPDIVRTNIATVTNLQRASEQFYEENPDLTPFKKVVASVFEEMASENPDKSYDQLMKEIAPEVRKRLELYKKAAQPTDKSNPPRLPRKKGKPGRAQEKPKTDPLQAELEAMNKTLGR